MKFLQMIKPVKTKIINATINNKHLKKLRKLLKKANKKTRNPKFKANTVPSIHEINEPSYVFGDAPEYTMSDQPVALTLYEISQLRNVMWEDLGTTPIRDRDDWKHDGGTDSNGNEYTPWLYVHGYTDWNISELMGENLDHPFSDGHTTREFINIVTNAVSDFQNYELIGNKLYWR